mmetsp:Transcript_37940/g.82124  ORF Transcript_37940/g.82124 Transcript_37940/m.82124 type:complete len:200 (-) Transcript_37940:483-1082(-)
MRSRCRWRREEVRVAETAGKRRVGHPRNPAPHCLESSSSSRGTRLLVTARSGRDSERPVVDRQRAAAVNRREEDTQAQHRAKTKSSKQTSQLVDQTANPDPRSRRPQRLPTPRPPPSPLRSIIIIINISTNLNPQPQLPLQRPAIEAVPTKVASTKTGAPRGCHEEEDGNQARTLPNHVATQPANSVAILPPAAKPART